MTAVVSSGTSSALSGGTAMETLVGERVAELVVSERTEVAEGVVTLRLTAPDGAELPAFTPGAHVDLLLEPDLTR